MLAFHDEQIAEHGGLPGLRDPALLDSALNRPRNLHHYGCDDVVALAASLASGIVQNHPFFDGNKRTSEVATETFLKLNGLELAASNDEVVRVWLALAANEMLETHLADIIRANVQIVSF